MKQVFVKPKAGLINRHPDTNAILPEEGGYWPDNAHARRALRDGDIELVTAPKTKKKGAK